MKIIQKTLATLLVICMMFTMLPGEMFSDVFNVEAESIGAYERFVANRGGNVNPTHSGGVISVTRVAFRVVLSRNIKNFLNNTKEQNEKVKQTYQYEFPNDSDLSSNTLFFYDKSGNFSAYEKYLIGSATLAGANSSINLKAGNDYQKLNIGYNQNSSCPTNTFKTKALNAKNNKTISSLSDLGKFAWTNYLPSYDEAIKTIGYIFSYSSGYDVTTKVEKYVDQGSLASKKLFNDLNIDKWTDDEKFDVSAGYVGLLTCFYVISNNDRSSVYRNAVTQTYASAIEDYITSNNITEKPVSIVIDTAIPLKNDTDKYSYVLPTIDYIEYGLLADSAYSISDGPTFIKTKAQGSKGNTLNMLKAIAEESAKTLPITETYATLGQGKPIRVFDCIQNTRMSNIANSNILIFGRGTTQVKNQYTVVDKDNSVIFVNWNYQGALNALKFDDEIYGFNIFGLHVASPELSSYYYVDASELTATAGCETKSKPTSVPKVQMYVKGNSTYISSMEDRIMNDPSFKGLQIEYETTRTVYEDSLLSEPIAAETKVASMSGTLKYEKDDLKKLLAGAPITLNDTDVLNHSYDKLVDGNKTIQYVYKTSAKVTLDGETKEYKWEDFCLKTDTGVYMNTVPFVVTSIRNTENTPEDIVIPAKSETPSQDENLSQNTGVISHYDLTTSGAEFAEVKQGTPGNEEYEAMGGVPSTEELYYSVGGSEFKVSMYLQYWMNEHSRDRTYTVHFAGTKCEYNNETEGQGDRMAEYFPKAQPGAGGSYTDVSIHCLNESGNGNGDWKIVAEWDGNSTHDPQTHSCSVCGATINDNHGTLDTSKYDEACAAADQLVSDLEAEIIKWNSGSDKETREITWTASYTAPHDTADATSVGNDGSANCEGNHGQCGGHEVSCGSGCTTTVYDNGAAHNAGAPCASDHHWHITLTATIPAHSICGPCCGHHLPALWDTWKQGLVFDYCKISQIRLYKLDQGLLQGTDDLFGTHEIIANVTSGNPTYFMNIATANELQFAKNKNGISPTSNSLSASDPTATITYDASNNRREAQSSRDGRLRYTLAEGQSTQTFSYSEQGDGSGGSYTFDPNKIAMPTMHDDVVYEAGTRSKNCDGMATTSNFGKSGVGNPIPVSTTGHANDWADGCLYTNIENNASTNFSSYYYAKNGGGNSFGDSYQPKEMKENDTKAMGNGYSEDYDHHDALYDAGEKTAYSDRSDSKDRATAEWKFFNAARETKIVVHVISDFCILQTSGGDQALYYYEQESEPTEAQEHFQKVKGQGKDLFDNNPLSMFTFSCEGGGYKYTKDEVSNFIVVGGYNGRYDQPSQKYKPYSLIKDDFITVGGEYDATKKTGTYQYWGGTTIKTIFDDDPAKTLTRPTQNTGGLKIVQDNLQIIPTTENGLYDFDNSSVWYTQVYASWSSVWADCQNFEYGTSGVGTYGNVALGHPILEKYRDEFYHQWGYATGLNYNTVYYRVPTGAGTTADDNTKTVNSVVVHTPVSVEDALVLEQGNLTVQNNAGGTVSISRDQRVNTFDFVNKNDVVNALKVCPLDPALCEFRTLNCKFTQDNLIADFDFESNYTDTEKVLVGSEYVEQTVSKRNTYQEGSSWITTNKVNDKTYTLPSGFTIESSGKVGSGKYLKATGTRWSIPFGDLGISNASQNRIKVHMDLTYENNSNNSMLVSFQNYGFILTPATSGEFGTFSIKSKLVGYEDQIGTTKHIQSSAGYNKVELDIVFGFNNIVDCYATINGVPCNAKVMDLRENWETVGGVRKLVVKNTLLRDEVWNIDGEVTATYASGIDDNTMPKNVSFNDLGSNINIGSWGCANNFNTNFYIDNLQIYLLGGSLTHTSACYEQVTTHQTKWVHEHTADCYTSEEVFLCGGQPLNANYQLGCGYDEDDNLSTSTTSVDFEYTGEVQKVTLQKGTYKLETWGAQGGSDNGGKGAYTTSTITVQSKTDYFVYVGGQGTYTTTYNVRGKGGFNGGGDAGINTTSSGWSNYGYGWGGGGGATDIRTSNTLQSRIIVAGGGGGGWQYPSYSYSGNNSWSPGNTPTYYYQGGWANGGNGGSWCCIGGYGATETGVSLQTSHCSNGTYGGAGALGQGGTGADTSNYAAGTGGGGGYYGGQGGGSGCGGATGGGGSSYATGSNVQKLSGNQTFKSPSGVNETGHSGNGYARITVVGSGTIVTNKMANPKTFNYTGNVQSVTLDAGKYKLEVWGAQGAYQSGYTSGYGGYSYGEITLDKKTTLYVTVGGQGSGTSGGYNGGGNGSSYTGGGGATHISLASGVLSNSTVYNSSNLLIVAGGGGGTGHTGGGGSGGGANNAGGNATNVYSGPTYAYSGYGGSSSTNSTIGQGGVGSSHGGGAGGGYYGGKGGYDCSYGGGGGSGYLGSMLSNTGGSNGVQSGNGVAKITPMPHEHTGTPGLDYPNGCYTTPTEHKHNFTTTIRTLICGMEEGSTGTVYDFGYTGNIQSISLQPGKYKLEVWGARGGQGADGNYSNTGWNYGKGGYSYGTITLTSATTLYIGVGGMGNGHDGSYHTSGVIAGGYNGGGNAYHDGGEFGGSGGGATHIATASGTLSSLSGNKSSVLIVAGGGGGSGEDNETAGNGGSAVTEPNGGAYNNGGQSFGQGTNYVNTGESGGGGGGGYYGGYGGQGGGSDGGTGYANTSKLTDIGGVTGENSGNGYAKITCLSHTHTDACYTTKKLICGMTAGAPDVGTPTTYNYTGDIQSVKLSSGTYKLEVWGAEGGSGYNSSKGGKGGYSVGTVTFTKETTIYIGVGGAGLPTSGSSFSTLQGGYNGGGTGNGNSGAWGGSGGGATHIATASGTLSSLSSNKSSVLIVAGGGGGGGHDTAGGAGGGTSGIKGTSGADIGTQTTGYSFGQGQSSTGHDMGAGGGGYYGAYASTTSDASAGGGSGYVSSNLKDANTIAGNASMPSTTGGTETGHSGNGYARITPMEHIHSASCFSTEDNVLTYNCESLPSGALACTGELNVETDLNHHKHSVSCLYNYTDIEPQVFTYQGDKSFEYVVPWSDYYTIQTIAPSANNATAKSASAKVYLTKDTILYVALGGRDGTNNKTTDIRTIKKPEEYVKTHEGEDVYNDLLRNSDGSVLIKASPTVQTIANDFGSYHFTEKAYSTVNHNVDGKVVITCANTKRVPTILESIFNGSIPEDTAEMYLGKDLADMVRINTQVFQTYSGFNYLDTKGIVPASNEGIAFDTNNNMICQIASGSDAGDEFYIPVNIEARATRAVRITLDNNTTATGVRIWINSGGTAAVTAPMVSNTANQVITLDVTNAWWNYDISRIYFDLVAGNTISGNVVVKKIELIGHADVSQNTTGYTNNNLFTFSNFTSSDGKGFVATNNCNITYSSNKMVVTSTGNDPITEVSETISSINTSAIRYIKLVFNNKGSADVGQLFYNTGSGYNETNSFMWRFCAGTNTVYIDTVKHVSYNQNTKEFYKKGSGWSGNISSLRFDWTTGINGPIEVSSITFIGTGNATGTGSWYYGCNNLPLNANYQLDTSSIITCGLGTSYTCNNSPLNSGGSITLYKFVHNSGCSYNGYTHYSNSTTCICGHTCGGYTTVTITGGQYVWYHNSYYADMHISSSNTVCTVCGSSNGYVQYSASFTSHTHTDACKHTHTASCYSAKHPLNYYETPSCGLAEGTIELNKDFAYTGVMQQITLQPGKYQLEVWGAQGASNSYSGGLGGYSKAILTLSTQKILYIGVGGQASDFNGGRASFYNHTGSGGATHIGYKNSELSGYSSDYNTQLLIVAGGGGGGAASSNATGGSGGGANMPGGSGSGGYSNRASGTCGTLTAGGYASADVGGYAGSGSFGVGGSNTGGTRSGGSMGGGGFYGGGSGGSDYPNCNDNDDGAGGGGSGYANTSLLTDISGSNGNRTGNGLARITGLSHTHIGSPGWTANGCYQVMNGHRHTGTAGTDTPNGCYTRPTSHKHVSACIHIDIVTITSTTRTTRDLIAKYLNPFENDTTGRQTVEAHIDMIPNRLENGKYNPIWLCKFLPLNEHICISEDGVELCHTYYNLNCTEPHHKGEHYGTYNTICWDACGDDNNHKNTKASVEANRTGEILQLANFLQLDAGFTVYFPNIGDFAESPATLGLSETTTIRCKGYEDRMDTTRWTREKRVKFSFDVIYHDAKNDTYTTYLKNSWIELDVPTEYFNFYLLSENAEMSNAKVEFECEAINDATGRGLQVNPSLSYTREIDTEYADAVTEFRNSVAGLLARIAGTPNGIYKMSKAVGKGNNSTTSRRAWGTNGIDEFFIEKHSTLEEALNSAVTYMDKQLETDFEGKFDDYINPNAFEPVSSAINTKVKPTTSNDNKEYVNNKLRMASFQALHGGYKSFYLDIVGRIGNFAIEDTEDFKFANFFKLPVMNDGDAGSMGNANNWLVEGVVKAVDENIQNYYIGDTYDIRLQKASPDTRWLDTYGTQAWMAGEIVRDVDGSASSRNINKPNLVSQILTSDINNIELYKDQGLKIGYDIYTSIATLGSYYGGYVQMIPKIYALKIDDVAIEGMERYNNDPTGSYIEKGTYIPLDVYIEKDGATLLVNGFDNAANGNANIGDLDVYDFSFNIDWTKEAGKRNYTIEEQARTKAVQDFFKTVVYETEPIVDENGDVADGGFDTGSGTVKSIEKYEIPLTDTNDLGTMQYMLMAGVRKYNSQTNITYGVHRTFIGSSKSYGDNTWNKYGVESDFGIEKNPDGMVDDAYYQRAVQRWHGKFGLPDASVFVPTGEQITDENREWIKTDAENEEDIHFAIIVTADITSISGLWCLGYSQPWFKTFTLNEATFDTSYDRNASYIDSANHYPGHRLTDGSICPHCLPPIIGVYGGAEVPTEYEIIKTH